MTYARVRAGSRGARGFVGEALDVHGRQHRAEDRGGEHVDARLGLDLGEGAELDEDDEDRDDAYIEHGPHAKVKR